MSARDKISKSAFNLLVGSSKDATVANIASAVATGRLKIDKQTLPMLIDLINQSIDAGYHRAHKSFMKSVDEALAEVSSDVQPTVKKSTTKKN